MQRTSNPSDRTVSRVRIPLPPLDPPPSCAGLGKRREGDFRFSDQRLRVWVIPMYSRRYAFVRARQLEGTYPGDPGLGVWCISSKRILFGWGQLDKAAWPDPEDGEGFESPEPRDVDRGAKANRIPYYFRIRDHSDCATVLEKLHYHARRAIERGRPLPAPRRIVAGFEITREFVHAPLGLIGEPEPGAAIIGCHGLGFVKVESNQFVFHNPWGSGWGVNGYGRMPFEFFDKWMVDAWAFQDGPLELPRGCGVRTIERTPRISLGMRIHTIEIYDSDRDERIGWAFAVPRAGWLDIEELFVRPLWRRQGFGGQLADRLKALAATLGLPLRAWVPFADAYPDNRGALAAALRRLDLIPTASGERWAAYCATPGRPSDMSFPDIRIPDRPAYSSRAARNEYYGTHRREQIQQRGVRREKLREVIARLPQEDPLLNDEEDWDL
jgi:GNAT superfamily N-acetyltransferase